MLLAVGRQRDPSAARVVRRADCVRGREHRMRIAQEEVFGPVLSDSSSRTRRGAGHRHDVRSAWLGRMDQRHRRAFACPSDPGRQRSGQHLPGQ